MASLNTTNSFFLEYLDKIRSGQIIVGRELMTELEQLETDLHDPAFQYDPADAHRRIRFIEGECKHSISPFAGMPFILELWEKAFLEVKYSFQMQTDGKWLRRFTRTLLLIARKNGKSTLLAADGNGEFFMGPEGVNIVCASNDYAQANIVFDEINNMRSTSPRLRKVSRKTIAAIFMGGRQQRKKTGKWSEANKAKIRKLSAKTGAKEGINVDKGIVDEIHEMKDNSLVAPIVQSMSTKDEPMLDEITTEGFTEDGYLDKTLVDARKVLVGELERPRWLIWLYTQDSESEIWQDRTSWVKSNPNLGVCKKWSYLDERVEEAKTDSATRSYVLAKDFNIRQSAASAWLQEAEIVNLSTFDIADFANSFYIGGNDFAETTDLCASKLLLMRPGDPVVYFYSHYWIPEEKLTKAPDDVDYQQWAKDGFLTIVPDSRVDSGLVAQWQIELFDQYRLTPFKSGYDNRFAKDYIAQMDEYFGKDVAVNVPQDFKCLSNPMRALESDIKHRLVNYNNCAGDLWCFKNTGFVTNNLGQIMPRKRATTMRIDGTAAALCCYAVLDWHRTEFRNLIGG